MPKNFGGSIICCTFAPANERFAPFEGFSLGYGVMVTLQILVLPFLVRVRVPQPTAESSGSRKISAFFLGRLGNNAYICSGTERE